MTAEELANTPADTTAAPSHKLCTYSPSASMARSVTSAETCPGSNCITAHLADLRVGVCVKLKLSPRERPISMLTSFGQMCQVRAIVGASSLRRSCLLLSHEEQLELSSASLQRAFESLCDTQFCTCINVLIPVFRCTELARRDKRGELHLAVPLASG